LSDWVRATAEELGGIDMVVSSVSALAIPDTEENWYQSFNVDLMGTVNLSKAAIPHLKKSDVASLIAISSVSGREADFASGPYGTMKTAIIGYRSEEHTSELQSRFDLVCRLLLVQKNNEICIPLVHYCRNAH